MPNPIVGVPCTLFKVKVVPVLYSIGSSLISFVVRVLGASKKIVSGISTSYPRTYALPGDIL